MATSHDRLFKELLRTFLWKFLELFVPELTPHLDRDALEPVEPQVFTDVTAGESHVADLVTKVRVREQEAYLLVHIESQAQSDANFPGRMFRYFARLHESYGLPVFPVAVLSDRAVGRRRVPDRYVVRVPHGTVMDFRYHLIELKRLAWRDFLRSDNPVAGALMSRMKIERRDRPLVKAACLRVIAGVTLDPARQRMLAGFVDTYLRLNEKETETYMLEIHQLDPAEEEAIMELGAGWKAEGRREAIKELGAGWKEEGRREAIKELGAGWKEEGRREAIKEMGPGWKEEGRRDGHREGLQEGLTLVLQSRFGERAASLEERLRAADSKRLNRVKARVLTATWEQLDKLLG